MPRTWGEGGWRGSDDLVGFEESWERLKGYRLEVVMTAPLESAEPGEMKTEANEILRRLAPCLQARAENVGETVDVVMLVQRPLPSNESKASVRRSNKRLSAHIRCSADKLVFDEPIMGNCPQVCPSKIRPPALLVRPPHCLKKKGTSASRHWSRRSVAQRGFIFLDLAPLSPPTMTHWSPSRWSRRSRGRRRGSQERNRT